MTTTRERAIELDDDLPLDTCPGCRQSIEGWRDWPCHYRVDQSEFGSIIAGSKRLLPWPFAGDGNRVEHLLCDWDRDMLTARVIRRSIAEGKL